MLKAVLLDMDETLCDTTAADKKAQQILSQQLKQEYPKLDGTFFCQRYTAGFYKKLNNEFPELLVFSENEQLFRQKMVQVLFRQQGIKIDDKNAAKIQHQFEQLRFDSFDFFPGIKAALQRLRQSYRLIVITNGPAYSQRPKIASISLSTLVDHIIIGGEQPEEKPAASIFAKALQLANCKPEQAIHVGDSLACDIKGAAAMAIPCIWIAPDKSQVNDEAKKLATYIIDSASEIEQTINHYAFSLQKISSS